MSQRTIGLLLIAVVAVGAVTGVAAAEESLGVTVEDVDGEPTVTVTENDTAVENATVIVSVADDEANASYAGTGEYATDENGTVSLPAPEEDVGIEVTATDGNATGSTLAHLDAPDGLEVEVDDSDAEPLVTVTDDDTAVENASVNVTAVDGENATYVGEGNYSTDANGTVELPAAEEDVTVNVTATFENETVSTTVDLDAPDGLEIDVSETDDEPVVTVTENDTAVENASVNVTTVDEENATNETEDDTNATYVGDGNYTTDENGTVELPAPEENVTVEVTATFENETATTTVDLTADDEADERPFGQLVREFISNLEDRDGGIGGAVSDFVTENNPGNAPDHAGGPEDPDEADDDDGNESDAPGNAPDHAGGDEDGERGPPAHAGPDDDADDDESGEESEEDADDDESEDDETEEDDAEEDEEDDAEEDEEDDESEDDETEEDDADDDETEEEDDESEDDADDGEEDDTEENEDDADPGNGNGPGNAPGNGNGNQP
ncbi:DNA primase [Halorubrum aethiopicum]|uniref:DNA primase n=1 Tax=Halorubrum aethiopicum TaxID=1758255 RepID=UPI000831CB5B|nr:DNA primase [Halorubrum aethiopicum]